MKLKRDGEVEAFQPNLETETLVRILRDRNRSFLFYRISGWYFRTSMQRASMMPVLKEGSARYPNPVTLNVRIPSKVLAHRSGVLGSKVEGPTDETESMYPQSS
jgi:hypothetical protein